MKVYKYPVEMTDEFEIMMPIGAEVLSVQLQMGKPYMWALVDETDPSVARTFRLAGTGHDIVEPNLEYVGTFQLNGGSLIFHLFEI